MGLGAEVARLSVEMGRSFNEGKVEWREKRSPANTTPTSIEELAKIFAAASQA